MQDVPKRLALDGTKYMLATRTTAWSSVILRSCWCHEPMTRGCGERFQHEGIMAYGCHGSPSQHRKHSHLGLQRCNAPVKSVIISFHLWNPRRPTALAGTQRTSNYHIKPLQCNRLWVWRQAENSQFRSCGKVGSSEIHTMPLSTYVMQLVSEA